MDNTTGNDILNLLTKSGIDLTKVGLDFTTKTLKIQGDIAIKILQVLLEYKLKQQSELKPGETNLKKLINSGKELKMTEIDKKYLKSFAKTAKNYGITYSVIRDKNKFNIVYTSQDTDRVKAVFESVIASRVNPIKKLFVKIKESVKKQQVNILKKVQSSVEKKLEKMQPPQDIEPVDALNKGDSVTSHNSKNSINEKNVKNKEDSIPEKKKSINEILESIDTEKINKVNVKAKTNKRGRPKKIDANNISR